MAEGTGDLCVHVSEASEESSAGSEGDTVGVVAAGSSASNTDGNKLETQQKHRTWFVIFVGMEITAFLCIMVVLIASLKVKKWRSTMIWDYQQWKWCALFLVILCGRLIGFVLVEAIDKLIWKFWLHETTLYFFHGVKKSVVLFIWLVLVSTTWGLLFHSSKRSETTRNLTHAVVGGIIGIAIWVVKTLLVYLVGSFHAKALLDRIKDAIRNRHALLAFSSNQKMELSDSDTMKELMKSIDDEKLSHLTYVRSNYGGKLTLTNEKGARVAAIDIFKKLASRNSRYAPLNTLKNLVNDEKVISHFEEHAETDEVTKEIQIKRSVFKKWVIAVYNDHDSVSRTLQHCKTAIDELNKICSIISLIVILFVWLIFMEFLTTKMLAFFMAQLALVAFIFGNSAKNVFESLIFVFIAHPFDVGDRCVIGGVQMVVEQMNVFTTVFLKYDGEKIYYPNSVLAVKPISNLYRSPSMSECLEFHIDLSTPIKILKHKLKNRIAKYLKKNHRRWTDEFSLFFLEIEDMHKMKMSLLVNHTINFQNAAKRLSRISDLVLEMKCIFEEFEIRYHLLPQTVYLISEGFSGTGKDIIKSHPLQKC